MVAVAPPGVVGAMLNGALAAPLRLIDCGESGALSAMLTVAVRVPAACGANVTVTVQCDAALTLVPHVFVSVKSLGFGPTNVRLEISRVAVPVFVSVKFCGALVVPTFVIGNV
jgi:hypothetical protein